eukprot:501134_1
MTARAYCVNDICSIPGPTLIVYPGITVYISLENAFDANTIDFSDSHGVDIINIHSHGLHISGLEDNVFIPIYPSQTYTYTWTIHPQHHIGTNWYHSHYHGTTEMTVETGLYGALIVDTDKNKILNYNKPGKINDYIIHLSFQYLIDNKYCNNCVGFVEDGRFGYRDGLKHFASSCTQWCQFGDVQRNNSGYEYDVRLDGSENFIDDPPRVPSLEILLVNNLYQPTIRGVETNKAFKLRFISSSSTSFVQIKFDYNTETKCSYSLIARDGIALQDITRDLSIDPYYGYFLLPAGGRIDVMLLCQGKGIATIYHNELHPNYKGINISYSMGRIGAQILFKLLIKNKCKNKDSYSHLTYPEPIYGFPYYLQELIDSNKNNNKANIDTICECSNYNRDRTEDIIVKHTNKCALELVEGPFDEYGNGLLDTFEVNGVIFNGSHPMAIYTISLNKIYEFYLNSDGHPFHIHVNPFMVQRNLLNGYIAKQYDLMDVLGFNFINDSIHLQGGLDPENQGVLIRYNTRDFVGNVILHCHFLGHEDLGMMAFIKIVDDNTNNLKYCQNTYGFQYNGTEEHFYKNHNDKKTKTYSAGNKNNNNNNNIQNDLFKIQQSNDNNKHIGFKG